MLIIFSFLFLFLVPLPFGVLVRWTLLLASTTYIHIDPPLYRSMDLRAYVHTLRTHAKCAPDKYALLDKCAWAPKRTETQEKTVRSYRRHDTPTQRNAAMHGKTWNTPDNSNQAWAKMHRRQNQAQPIRIWCSVNRTQSVCATIPASTVFHKWRSPVD